MAVARADLGGSTSTFSYYSLRSVTGNVRDTGNDLLRFGSANMEENLESKSWMRWIVGVDVENLI